MPYHARMARYRFSSESFLACCGLFIGGFMGPIIELIVLVIVNSGEALVFFGPNLHQNPTFHTRILHSVNDILGNLT